MQQYLKGKHIQIAVILKSQHPFLSTIKIQTTPPTLINGFFYCSTGQTNPSYTNIISFIKKQQKQTSNHVFECSNEKIKFLKFFSLKIYLRLTYFVNCLDLQLIEAMAYRATVNLRVFAGIAKPNPKMGQSLGPLGINMMKFCEQFNKITTHIRGDVPMKVKLTAFTDRTFKFKIKPPQTSWFLKKAAGKQKFTNYPSHFGTVYIPIQYIYEIAKVKKQLDPDLQKLDVATIMTMIQGQMTSLGAVVIDEPIVADPVSIKMKI